MTDDMTNALQEIAKALNRRVEQHDEMSERNKELQGRWSARSAGMISTGPAREEFEKRRETFQSEMKEKSEQWREEDRQFKRDLLAALDRHNRTLELILERLNKSS